MKKPSTFYRVWEAVEILATGKGNDNIKLENVRSVLLVFSENDFETSKQRKLYKEIKGTFLKYPHWSSIKIGDSKAKTLSCAHWTIKKKLKKQILELLYFIIYPD